MVAVVTARSVSLAVSCGFRVNLTDPVEEATSRPKTNCWTRTVAWSARVVMPFWMVTVSTFRSLTENLKPLLVLLKEMPLRPDWTADFRVAVLLATRGAGSSLVKLMVSVLAWPA